MAVITNANFYGAFGSSVPVTLGNNSVPKLLDMAVSVYDRSDVLVSSGATQGSQTVDPLSIKELVMFPYNNAGVTVLVAPDTNGNPSTTAATSAGAADPQATGALGDTTTPYWYRLLNSRTGKVELTHQSRILFLTELKALMDSQNNNFA